MAPLCDDELPATVLDIDLLAAGLSDFELEGVYGLTFIPEGWPPSMRRQLPELRRIIEAAQAGRIGIVVMSESEVERRIGA